MGLVFDIGFILALLTASWFAIFWPMDESWE